MVDDGPGFRFVEIQQFLQDVKDVGPAMVSSVSEKFERKMRNRKSRLQLNDDVGGRFPLCCGQRILLRLKTRHDDAQFLLEFSRILGNPGRLPALSFWLKGRPKVWHFRSQLGVLFEIELIAPLLKIQA